MRVRFIAVFVCLGLAAATGEYFHSLPEPHVRQVLIECRACKIRFSRPLRNGKSFVRPQYLTSLEKIDVSQCPEPFQKAWGDYERAWRERIKQQRDKEKEILIDVAEVAMAVETAGATLAVAEKETVKIAGKHAMRPGPQVIDTRSAWQNVEKCSVKFNCVTLSDTPGF